MLRRPSQARTPWLGSWKRGSVRKMQDKRDPLRCQETVYQFRRILRKVQDQKLYLHCQTQYLVVSNSNRSKWVRGKMNLSLFKMYYCRRKDLFEIFPPLIIFVEVRRHQHKGAVFWALIIRMGSKHLYIPIEMYLFKRDRHINGY